MIPQWGSFPFCNAPASILAGAPGTEYPVGMLAADIRDFFLNAKTLRVSVDAVVNGQGNNGSLGGFVFTHRKVTGGCLGFQHVSNSNMRLWNADIRIDFEPTVRRNRSAGTSLYYPSIEATFIADQVRLSSRTEAMETGSIDFLGKGFITLYANEPMVVFGGGVSIVERYDAITFTPTTAAPGQTVVIEGVAFDGVSGVQFGEVPAQFTIDADGRKIRAVVPQGASVAPIWFDQDEDRYCTRLFFKPS